MRTQTQSIVAAIVLLSLVSGAVGCRSNGTGPWYHPKTYSWHNPFKESEAPAFKGEGAEQANKKPSMEATPNVSTPPGGYANPGKESGFLAGSQQKAVQTQYGHGAGSETNHAAQASPYSVPEAMTVASVPAPAVSSPEPYNPYAAAVDTNSVAATPGAYQQTRYYEQQQPVANPMTASPAPMAPMADNAPVYGNPYGAPSNPAPMNQSAQPAQSPYAPMPTASPYGNTQTTYGVPASTPYNVDQPLPGGYTANPSSYQPTTTGGF